jgi:hypothetical protein
VPTCVPWIYLPTTPPQMITVNLPVAPEAAYVKARQAVAAMGGRLLTDDVTVRMAFAHVPGPVVLNIAVLPDRNGASVQVIGHVRATHPEAVAPSSAATARASHTEHLAHLGGPEGPHDVFAYGSAGADTPQRLACLIV